MFYYLTLFLINYHLSIIYIHIYIKYNNCFQSIDNAVYIVFVDDDINKECNFSRVQVHNITLDFMFTNL